MSVEDGRVVIEMHGERGYIFAWQPQRDDRRISKEAEESLLTQAQAALTGELLKRKSRQVKQERVMHFTEAPRASERAGEGSKR